jgi:signal transduction histidine kinase
MEEDPRRLLHTLEERVKELTALHRAVRLMQDGTRLPADVLNDIVALLPPAWQYPEVAAARIVLDGTAYATPNFSESRWKQTAALPTSGNPRGVIEVVYLEERPPEGEGPFLPEERTLINSLADSVASYLDRKQAEEALRRAHERLQTLFQQLMHVQEQERRQLARDLHDEIGQALTAVKMNLQTLQRSGGSAASASPLDDSLTIIDGIMHHVRDLALDLRPSLLDDLGLVSAVRWYVSRQAERAGWTADVAAEESLSRLPPDLAIACYRLVQEAVTNAMRHAKASHISVSLQRQDDDLDIRIRDDGTGFDVLAVQSRVSQRQSLGLLGMEERVRLLDGRLVIDSHPGKGTEVRVRIPFHRPAGMNRPESGG